MERMELHSKVEEKLTECWDAYKDTLLTLPPGQIIDKAGELAAARSCLDELTENPEYYPEHLLEHLLQYDDPLEILREQQILQRPHRVAVQNLIVHRRSMRLLHDLGWMSSVWITAVIWNMPCGRCGIMVPGQTRPQAWAVYAEI